MGRQIIGGTRSKIRGKVGSNIYQVKNSPDGLVQHVYKAPESRENPNTEGQAKARMIMGQIQRMFHALPDIIKDAWVDVSRGRMSFQKFAKTNYPILKNETLLHWESGGEFDWQDKYSVVPPAGVWQLSQGSLPELVWDSFLCSAGLNNEFEFTISQTSPLQNYGHLLQRLGLDRNSVLHIFFYIKYTTDNLPKIEHLELKPNPAIPDSFPLSRMGDDEFFIHESDWDCLGLTMYGREEWSLNIYRSNPSREYYIACVAMMITRTSDTGTLFSSSRFQWAQKKSFYYLRRNSPADVWNSWFNN